MFEMIDKMCNKLLSWKLSTRWVLMMIILDIILCVVIVTKVKYTEIDWKAYMEEVEGYLLGERDYTKLQGCTGPLVYPAGFLYVFSMLRTLTENGTNILYAQIIFVGIYIANLITVLSLYIQGDSTVSLVLAAALLLSKRVHSIYMLRMFNDCIAVLFGYLAILCFTRGRFRFGCLLYSFGVSIKMNMLLHAPGILLVLLMATGYTETFICLSICAGLQLAVGYPFLSTYPVQYLTKSFELGRVFMHKWTVNFKFLSEEVFVAKELSLLLLVLTVIAFIVFARKWVVESYKAINSKQTDISKHKSIIGIGSLSPAFITTVIFSSNFIGVVFARSLHYQFYCWYFHMLPYLLSHTTSLHFLLKCAVLVGVEVSFNVFPATWWSSALLQVCHITLLIALYITPTPHPVKQIISSEDTKKKEL